MQRCKMGKVGHVWVYNYRNIFQLVLRERGKVTFFNKLDYLKIYLRYIFHKKCVLEIYILLKQHFYVEYNGKVKNVISFGLCIYM